MFKLAGLSIKNKLTLILLIVSLSTVLMVCVTFIFFDRNTFRKSFKTNLITLTELTADNSATYMDIEPDLTDPTMFQYKQEAKTVLEALRADPSVVGAALYTPDSDDYETWERSEGIGMLPRTPPALGTKVDESGKYILSVAKIALSEGSPGRILIKASTEKISQRSTQIILFSLAVLVVASILAIGIGLRFQRIISEPIDALLSTMDIVTQNEDFTVRATKHANDELGRLVEGFNTLLEHTNQMLQKVQEAVGHLNETTQTIVSASQDQASGATQQSSSVTQTVAAVEESATQSGQISESANRVAELADESLKTVQEGQRLVNEVIEAMNEIMEEATSTGQQIADLEEKSSAIEDVSLLITNIANKTSLISLNAEIEAVNAGDAGLGFSVVASEVRTLAEQTQQATQQITEITREIKSLIESSVQASDKSTDQVQKGVELVKSTGVALNDIIETVNQTVEAAQVIDLNTRQQQSAAEQLVKEMETIDQVARQVELGASSTVETSKELEEVSFSLQSLLNGERQANLRT
ncbi:hypothetical protein CMK12_06655 [Candidatus Poribacteria bacterium]|jgi:methyl-accepting chemotaxis protein|nr:hypothetical protein [Candidatus Poribacteria bacterium]